MTNVSLSVQLLGGFSLHANEQAVPDDAWRLRKAKSLIKLIALTPERRLHRDRACELLWPDRDGASAANNLHQALHSARRALDAGSPGASGLLVMRDETVMFGEPQPAIDFVAFEAAASAARDGGDEGSYVAALALYVGELLPEDRYEEWTVAARESVRETHLQLLIELSELRSEAGDRAGAIEALHDAVISEPLNEEAHRRLMRLYAEHGRRQEALAQYGQLRSALRAEYEADPDDLTRELYQEILTEQFEPPDRASTQTQVAAAFPDAVAEGNLPHLLTSFIGRERELAAVREMTTHSRLVTLTGPGGSGKTRLSIESARALGESYDDGAFLIELAGIGAASLVGQQAASVFGVDVHSDRDPVDVLIRHLRDRRLLIVLDNCEHLIDACADFAERLLAACPHVQMLATSREPLRIQGEVTWRVPSLSLPDRDSQSADVLKAYASVQLFCERAVAAAPGFDLTDENAAAVADICFGLDGMPLAIELAAARCGSLTPEQLAERLDDALGLLGSGQRGGLTRQQTLEATIRWSYELLDDEERALFRRLGVFAGSFSLDAIEDVCADDTLPSADVAEILTRLVDKSLVGIEDSEVGRRYRMLETIKQFARRQLAANNETQALEASFCDWCLDFAYRNDPQQNHGYVPIDTQLLEREHDNLRAALALTLQSDPASAMELATRLSQFWIVRGHFTEGAQWLDAVLDASTGETRLRARALHAACGLAVRRGKTAVLVPNTTEAAEIFRNAGDTKSLPGALQQLAVMQWATCDLEAAEETLLETVEIARELGMREVEATALHAESLIANTRSDYAGSQRSLLKCRALLEAVDPGAQAAYWVTTPGMHVVHDAAGDQPRMFFEDTVQHFRRVDNRIAIAYVLCDFANAARAAEDFEPASQALDQATELFRASDDLHGLAFALNASGNLARTRGEYETARSFLEQGHAARHEIGDARALRMSVSNFGLLAAREGDLQDARAQLNRFIALAHRSDDGAAIAGGLVNLGNVELDAGEPDRALPLLQESSARLAAQRLDRAAAWSRIAQIEATFALGRIDQTEACATAAAADLERIGDRQGLARLAQLDPRMSDESSANAPLSER